MTFRSTERRLAGYVLRRGGAGGETAAGAQEDLVPSDWTERSNK